VDICFVFGVYLSPEYIDHDLLNIGCTGRCLVKMQKRGKGNCPMCRAPTVLIADRCKSLVFATIHRSRADLIYPPPISKY
jgi:hypothetical protein